MHFFLVSISFIQMSNIILALVLLFLIFKYFETTWSYKISKPFAWEQAVNNKLLSSELIKLERNFRDKVRFYNLWFQVEYINNNNVKGAFAELGVHTGETAKVLHYMDTKRPFYLFDTFDGFDKKDLAIEEQNDVRFSTSNFANTSIEKVKKHINGNENLIFKPGFFPDTTEGLEDEIFSLVHIDADLYAPTLAALNYFYPKLSKGGVIIIHDYNHNWDGIPKAVNEFILTIPESVISLADWQGSAMIIKNTI